MHSINITRTRRHLLCSLKKKITYKHACIYFQHRKKQNIMILQLSLSRYFLTLAEGVNDTHNDSAFDSCHRAHSNYI